MKDWIIRLWAGIVILIGAFIIGQLFYGVYSSAHPPDTAQEKEEGIFGLTEDHQIRWEGLDKPPRFMRIFRADLTAYSATNDQTDDDPCITASGATICVIGPDYTKKNIDYSIPIVAHNGLPFGTRLWSKETGIVQVQDRMNTRYGNSRVDLAVTSMASGDLHAKSIARKLGIKRNIQFIVID